MTSKAKNNQRIKADKFDFIKTEKSLNLKEYCQENKKTNRRLGNNIYI